MQNEDDIHRSFLGNGFKIGPAIQYGILPTFVRDFLGFFVDVVLVVVVDLLRKDSVGLSVEFQRSSGMLGHSFLTFMWVLLQ